MITDIEKLEKIVKEQAKQIEQLKKVTAGLQKKLMQTAQKTERAYQTGRKNSLDINNINEMMRRNG